MEHNSIEILGEQTPEVQEILTPTALELLQQLHRTFNPQRLELLELRKQRQQEIDDGITHKVKTNDDQIIDEERFTQSLQEEISKLIEERGDLSYDPEQLKVATDLFHKMSTNQQFDQFLTLPAYEYL
ncbi:uncharacterized protein METZ01_LOCUS513472 [marine metagenome]|uniref:Malate synthase N-terminal domain-containing protein n=1 Tax=marine metagenome TaxID=408172 RepID=A0A383EWY0_9ZZZZ